MNFPPVYLIITSLEWKDFCVYIFYNSNIFVWYEKIVTTSPAIILDKFRSFRISFVFFTLLYFLRPELPWIRENKVAMTS